MYYTPFDPAQLAAGGILETKDEIQVTNMKSIEWVNMTSNTFCILRPDGNIAVVIPPLTMGARNYEFKNYAVISNQTVLFSVANAITNPYFAVNFLQESREEFQNSLVNQSVDSSLTGSSATNSTEWGGITLSQASTVGALQNNPTVPTVKAVSASTENGNNNLTVTGSISTSNNIPVLPTPESGSNVTYITTATTTNILTQHGVLGTLSNAANVTTGLITLYDSSTASGNIIWEGTLAAGQLIRFGVPTSAGLTVVTAAANAIAITSA